VKFSLTRAPLIYREQTIIDYQMEYEIQRSGRDFVGRYGARDTIPHPGHIVVQVCEETPEALQATVNSFIDALQYEMIKNRNIKIWAGNYYLPARILSATPQVQGTSALALVNVKVQPQSGLWQREYLLSIQQETGGGAGQFNKRYAYRYPYRYGRPGGYELVNPAPYSSPCLIRVYGPASNPSINISTNVYAVNLELSFNEILEIDTLNRTLQKKAATGMITNEFSKRGSGDIFADLEPGIHSARASGDFKFDVVIYERKVYPPLGGG
jgi:hypothetical protein